MSKKIKYLKILILISLIILPSAKVSADAVVDFNRRGSIKITLKESTDNTNIEGSEITIYQVAVLKEKNNNIAFEYIEELKDCPNSLEDLKEPSITLINYIKDKNIPKISLKTNKEGLVQYNNLDLGLYLVMQTNNIKGYTIFSPFFIILPEYILDNWNYDINAFPKTDIIKLTDITVKKVWNKSNHTNLPLEVNIELLKNGEVIDTVKLNKDNNWHYTWKNLEKSDKYTVREINIPIGYTASYRNDGNIFTITNTDTLIKTGQNILIIQVLAVTGLILIGIGIIYAKKSKNK